MHLWILPAAVIILMALSSVGCASKVLMKNCDKLNDKWYECEKP